VVRRTPVDVDRPPTAGFAAVLDPHADRRLEGPGDTAHSTLHVTGHRRPQPCPQRGVEVLSRPPVCATALCRRFATQLRANASTTTAGHAGAPNAPAAVQPALAMPAAHNPGRCC